MKKFVILAQPRTGTNAFVSRLNKIDGVNCHYEVFHKKEIFLHNHSLRNCTKEERENLQSLEYRDTDWKSYLSELEEKTLKSSPDTKYFGFKLFYGHNKELLNYVMKSDEWIKIIVHRANLLDQHLSEEIAKITGKYVFDDKSKTGYQGQTTKVDFNFDKFIQFVKKERSIFNEYISNSIGSKRAVEFNSLINGELEWFADLLGINNLDISKTEAKTKKQNSSKTIDKVENFNLLENRLKGGEFEWMIK